LDSSALYNTYVVCLSREIVKTFTSPSDTYANSRFLISCLNMNNSHSEWQLHEWIKIDTARDYYLNIWILQSHLGIIIYTQINSSSMFIPILHNQWIDQYSDFLNFLVFLDFLFHLKSVLYGNINFFFSKREPMILSLLK